ncbi:MAG: alkaline phosphatase family protein [Candidatus Thorarchaeota archaeon]
MLEKPDYTNSIVNLMSSIGQASGVTSPYSPLEFESLGSLNDVKNIVLLIVDGIGYNYLREYGGGSLLKKNLKESISSVYLPSTGSAITSVMTGVAPQQHAVTGWFVYLKEFGLVSRILPYSNTIDYNNLGVDISNVVDVQSVFRDINRDYSLVLTETIFDSVFTKNLTGNANRLKYSGIDQFFSQIKNTITSSARNSYIYGYYPDFDAVSHILGSRSQDAQDQLHEFDKHLTSFVESIEGTDTTIIVTGDHGFDDVDPTQVIYTRNHAELNDYLIMPFCGDTRSVYAYVRPRKVEQFERYVEKEFGDACDIFPSSDLVDEGWFGLFEPHPRLLDRIGDYTLIFREGHAMMNCFPGVEPFEMMGHHGGASADEMYVPLIVIEP